MPSRAFLHYKYAAIRAVARKPEQNCVIRAGGDLRGTLGRPRIRKRLFQKSFLSQKLFFERVFDPIEVVTGPCKNEGIRAGDHLRGTL